MGVQALSSFKVSYEIFWSNVKYLLGIEVARSKLVKEHFKLISKCGLAGSEPFTTPLKQDLKFTTLGHNVNV